MTTTIERRDAAVAWPEVDMEVRAVGDGLQFRGYAAVFDSPSEDLGGFREVIKPGAFARSIAHAKNGRDIKAFLNHNMDVVLGSTRAGTLRLAEDQRGLVAEIDLPDSAWGQPVAAAVRRGDISSMSFGFNVPKKRDDGGPAEEWSQDDSTRTLHEVRLWEVSPVTGWPAYAATSASVRTLAEAIDWTDEESARSVLDGLTDEQRGILFRLLNREQPAPFISPVKASLMARHAARLADAASRGLVLSDPEPQPGAPSATT